MTPIDAGTVLQGKYRLEALIGRGGMGSVWRAEHLGLTAPVAVKLLDFTGLGGTQEALARFHREARAAASIRSPHVVQILDHGVDAGTGAPFIVMELMEGESLADRLARRQHITPAETATILVHVARALTRAHDAGIVHRDLKPDNVFLVRNEDDEVAKVLDFGIAKSKPHALQGDADTRTGAIMGTPYYMSPEQISGAKHVDFRTDLWALGVIAYECILGTRPFDAETIGGLALRICAEPLPVPSQRGAVPAGFDAWFARVVNRDPQQRFASARETVEALRLVCTGNATPAPAPLASSSPPSSEGSKAAITAGGLSQPTGRNDIPKRSSKVPWFGATALFAALTAGLVWWQQSATVRAQTAPSDSTTSTPRAPSSAVPHDSSSPAPAAIAPEAQSLKTMASPTASAPAPAALHKGSSLRRPPLPAAAAALKLPAPPAVAAPTTKPPVRDVIDDRH